MAMRPGVVSRLKAENKVTVATERALCSLDNYLVLPDDTMDDRIAEARRELGRDCVFPRHHYQRDEVIRFAAYTGVYYKLSKISAQTEGRYIVFCGVHFMRPRSPILITTDQ